MSAGEKQKILFFDGVCGLCNAFVNFVMTADTRERFQFAALQGETAAKLLPSSDTQDLNSFVYLENGQTYRRSTAALRVLSGLGGIFSLFTVFLLIPTFLRDPIYNMIASNRYKWFGKKETCRLPTPEERARFLA